MLLYMVLVIISLFVYFKLFTRPAKHINDVSSKYILITGCDTGFGRETAIRLDNLGFNVFATCLTDEGEKSLRNCCSERLDVIRLDVTDSMQVKEAFDYVKKTIPSESALWSVINNAGCITLSPLDWQPLDQMKKMADVNLWGLIDVTKTFLPLLKKSNGRLVNVASIGGRVSLPYIGGYCITKFGVEAFTDALRRELCKWNMKIILIEPGFFKTNMTARTALSDQWNKIWSGLSQEKRLEYGEEFFSKTKEHFLTGVVDTCVSSNTNVVPEAIADAVISSTPKQRYVLGWDSSLIWIWMTRIPTWLGDFFINRISKIQPPATDVHHQHLSQN